MKHFFIILWDRRESNFNILLIFKDKSYPIGEVYDQLKSKKDQVITAECRLNLCSDYRVHFYKTDFNLLNEKLSKPE